MGLDEPITTINGHRLTHGQAMAVRVAISSFHMEMEAEGALGNDEHGEFMRKAYRARLEEVFKIIFGPANGELIPMKLTITKSGERVDESDRHL